MSLPFKHGVIIGSERGKVMVPREKQEKAFEFVMKRVKRGDYGKYEKRGGVPGSKKPMDDFGGKISEEGTKMFIETTGKGWTSDVDYNVYSIGKKGWGEDLRECSYEGFSTRIHVKSVSPLLNIDRYPLSWTFQDSDPGTKGKSGHDPVLDKGKSSGHLVSLCRIDVPCYFSLSEDSLMDEMEVDIYAIIFADLLQIEGLLGDPVKEDLRGIKKVLYLDIVPNDWDSGNPLAEMSLKRCFELFGDDCHKEWPR